MPVWLQVVLAVWGCLAPFLAAAWKWGRSLTNQLAAIGQWFDPKSALGQQYGTLPSQVGAVRTKVDEIVDNERIVHRIAAIERTQDDHAGTITQIDHRLRQIEAKR